MPDPRRINNNLLVLLYRLAYRQQENFATESFAHLLQQLIDREPLAAARVLDWLTDHELYFSRRSSGGLLSVRTQDYTYENGIPDIRIESDDVDVIVEVKLGGDLTFEQVEAYSKELSRERTCSVLVALVGSAPRCELPPGVRVRLWRELGVILREEARALIKVRPHALPRRTVRRTVEPLELSAAAGAIWFVGGAESSPAVGSSKPRTAISLRHPYQEHRTPAGYAAHRTASATSPSDGSRPRSSERCEDLPI